MEMSSFWKMIPVAAFAALALVACDSGSSSDPGAAESSSAAALPNGLESSGAATSSSAVVMSSGIVAEPISSGVVQSSAAKSSSSAAAPASSDGSTSTGAWPYLNPAISYGEFTDDRDGRVYKSVVIGTQTWMAENLNYADSAAMPNLAGNTWCQENSADNCVQYGRLYTWTGAMNIASFYQAASASAVIKTPQQGVCPAGWHLPTDAEYGTLYTAVGGTRTAGTKLKSTRGWPYGDNSTNNYGFSVLPAGGRYGNGYFYAEGLEATLWSASEYDENDDASYEIFYYNAANDDGADVIRSGNLKGNAYSVRCVQD